MKKYITTDISQFINEQNTNNDFFVTYTNDKFVSHITSKKRELSIKKNGFKTGYELDVSEKRKAIYFADIDVNYGIYARNGEGELNFGDEIGEVVVNIKGLKLLNMTYSDSDRKFINHHKYKNFSTRGELDLIPYDIDGTISFLDDGRVYEVVLKKIIANKLL